MVLATPASVGHGDATPLIDESWYPFKSVSSLRSRYVDNMAYKDIKSEYDVNVCASSYAVYVFKQHLANVRINVGLKSVCQ